MSLAALVAVVLTAIIYTGRHTLGQSLNVLSDADPAWLLLALAAETASLTAFGLSRRRLLRANGYPAAFSTVMAVTYAANALSISVPFAGAELAVVYSYRQFRRHGLDAATTSWSLAVSAIFSTSSLAFLLVAGALAGGDAAAAAFGLGGAALYLVPGVAVLLALRFGRVRGLLQDVLAWLARLSRRMFGKPENGAEGLGHFLEDVSSTGLPWRGYAAVSVLAVANWVFDCAALACAIRAMSQPVPWHALLLVYGAGAVVGSTGITPGGFALVELTLTAALTASGLHATKALAAVLAYRLVNFWLVLIAGWIVMAVLTHRGDRDRGVAPEHPELVSFPCRGRSRSWRLTRTRSWRGCASASPCAGCLSSARGWSPGTTWPSRCCGTHGRTPLTTPGSARRGSPGRACCPWTAPCTRVTAPRSRTHSARRRSAAGSRASSRPKPAALWRRSARPARRSCAGPWRARSLPL